MYIVWLLPFLNYAYLPNSPHFVALRGDINEVMSLLKIIDNWNREQSFFDTLEQQSLTIQKFDKIGRKARGKIASLFLFEETRISSILLCFISFAIWFCWSTIYEIQYLFVVYFKYERDYDIDQDPLEETINANTNFAVESILTTCDLISSVFILIFMNFRLIIKNLYF